MENNDLINQLVQAFLMAMIALIPVLAAVLAKAAKEYLRSLDERAQAHIGADKWLLMKDKAIVFVKAAAQIDFESNDERLEYVVGLIMQASNEAGIPMTYTQSRALVEGTLYGIREGAGG